jgi:hypothetical protein
MNNAKVERSTSVRAIEWLRSRVDIGSSDNCGVIHDRETAAARAILGSGRDQAVVHDRL